MPTVLERGSCLVGVPAPEQVTQSPGAGTELRRRVEGARGGRGDMKLEPRMWPGRMSTPKELRKVGGRGRKKNQARGQKITQAGPCAGPRMSPCVGVAGAGEQPSRVVLGVLV